MRVEPRCALRATAGSKSGLPSITDDSGTRIVLVPISKYDCLARCHARAVNAISSFSSSIHQPREGRGARVGVPYSRAVAVVT